MYTLFICLFTFVLISHIFCTFYGGFKHSKKEAGEYVSAITMISNALIAVNYDQLRVRIYCAMTFWELIGYLLGAGGLSC